MDGKDIAWMCAGLSLVILSAAAFNSCSGSELRRPQTESIKPVLEELEKLEPVDFNLDKENGGGK